MESNGADEVMISTSDVADCSEATVEIKIKTLDSQTYTLRVDKCMPVPALKEQIATVTGVLSEQQRLICRGKVLKDDQLLSAYHVEDGHTLHLVVRQQLPPPSESLSDYSEEGASRGPSSQTRPSVVVGAFNLSEQGDGVLPDLSRIVSAVLSSFGATNIGNGSEGADLREQLRIHGFSGLTDSNRQQPDQTGIGGQSNSMGGASSLPNSVPLEHLPLVIPDSLTTLSQYLSHMRHEFSSSVGGRGNDSQAADSHEGDGQETNAASHTPRQDRLPTPGALSEVMLSTRQLLIEQAGECLNQLARQLEGHANITDPSARMSIQSNAMRSGDLLQKLGALLFELGRTTMTLRMGQTPGEAVVNAGPAVFISTSGPNPIMVQPLPFQQGTSIGAIPFGNVQPSSGFSGGSFGTGFLPRNIDIRIRAGLSTPSNVANGGEPTDNLALSGHAHSVNQAATVPGVPSSTREPDVRVLPIRTVVAAVPASVGHASSDSSRGPVGLFYPVLARVQQVTNGTLNSAGGSQTSDERQPTSLATVGQPSSEPTVRQGSNVFPERDGNSVSTNEGVDGRGFSTQIHGRLDQLLRTLFPGEQIHVGEVNVQSAASTSAAAHVGMTEVAAGGQEAAVPRVTDEGIFLSNMLRQVMPLISESSVLESNGASSDLADSESRNVCDPSTQENSDVGASVHRVNSPPTPPNSKRQKRE